MEVTQQQQQQQQQRRQQRCWRQGNSPRAAVFAGCQHCSFPRLSLAQELKQLKQVCSLSPPSKSPHRSLMCLTHHVYVCHAWHPAVQLFHEPHILLNSTLHTVLC